MGHALLAGALGTLISALGAAAMWSSTVGQHWYALSLVLTAIPTAWLGAKLRLMQFHTEPTAALRRKEGLDEVPASEGKTDDAQAGGVHKTV